MKIHNFLTDDREAKRLVAYGRHLYSGRDLILRHEAAVAEAARLAGLPEYLNMYTKMAEELGLDPHNDNVKADFLLSQLKNGRLFSILKLYTYMFKHALEPFGFQDDDIFYYVLGQIGDAICREDDRQSINEIMQLIIEELESP